MMRPMHIWSDKQKVGVVHSMQPPKTRQRMKHDVLEVDGEIEKDNPEQQGEPGRQG